MPEVATSPLLAGALVKPTSRIDTAHVNWPSDGQLVAGGYTDVLISLGTNHCRYAGDEWVRSAVKLV